MIAGGRPGYFTVALFLVLLMFNGAICSLWIAGDHEIYLRVMGAYGFGAFDWPFLDLSYIIEAKRCQELGFDVLEINPCDVLGRTLDYSPLWLDVTPGFLVPEHLDMAGMVLGLGVIVLIPLVTRPASIGDFLVRTAASLSTTLMFALERGDNDLVILILVVLAAVAWGGGAVARGCGYLLCLAAGLLKYYPLVLIVMVLRERIAGTVLACGIFAALAGAFVLHYGEAIQVTLRNIPRA